MESRAGDRRPDRAGLGLDDLDERFVRRIAEPEVDREIRKEELAFICAVVASDKPAFILYSVGLRCFDPIASRQLVEVLKLDAVLATLSTIAWEPHDAAG